ncbi:hypothetical protein [uncultured Psychrosphaera sp.]|uniref:hypothetical protein n=1 Tax=uncultured Psychrosphaera sp. TaxID=1403522 RepID=UPI00260485B4|nr:hypothetical protein [uncultured Psychrosphaera sp.]
MSKISAVLICIVLTGVNDSLHAFPVKDVEFTQDKTQIQRVTNQSTTNKCGDFPLVSKDSLFAKMHADLPFLFNKPICLYSLSAKKVVNVNKLQAYKNAVLIASRYATTLNNIASPVDRLNFVKAFLSRATKKYFITESYLKEDISITPDANLVAITVWGKNTRDRLSGEIIKLLDKTDMHTNGTQSSHIEEQESPQFTAEKIKSLVDYVLDEEM